MIVPIADGEAILWREKREISILVASEEVTFTHARCPEGEQIAGPQVHHEHTDAFYVLEGELTFEIGRGIRDGVDVEWDISTVPLDGGLPASEAIVRSRDTRVEPGGRSAQRGRPWAARA